jgi:hypothetical protein
VDDEGGGGIEDSLFPRIGVDGSHPANSFVTM